MEELRDKNRPNISRDGTRPPRRAQLWLQLLLLAVIVWAISLAAYSYYRDFREGLHTSVNRQLASIARLKVDELVQWRKERIGDGLVVSRSARYADIKRFLTNPNDSLAHKHLVYYMNQLRFLYGYERIVLIDKEGIERLEVPGSNEKTPEHVLSELPNVLKSRKTELLDFNRDSETGPVHLSVLAPILGEDAGNEPLGVMVLIVEPEDYLYPLIERWPTPSDSGETLLVRREGDSVVFLNQLRFNNNAALNLRIPLSRVEVPSVMAVTGYEGSTFGPDYRGIPVIAYVRAVPDSPWYLVAKLNRAEAYAPLRQQVIELSLLIFTLLIGASWAAAYMRRMKIVSLYRDKAAAVEAMRLSEQKFSTLFHRASMPIVLSRAPEYAIVDVNDAWVALFGFSKNEVVGKNSTELNINRNPAKRSQAITDALDKGALLNYEQTLYNKAGEALTVLTNISVIMLAGVPHHLTTVQDITARKKAEVALRESEARVRATLDNMLEGCQILNRDLEYIYINDAAALQNRRSKEELIGRKYGDVWPGITETYVYESVRKCAEEGATNHFVNHFVFPDGAEGWFELSVQPVPEGVFILSVDVTERVRVENDLRASEERFRSVFEAANVGKSLTELDGKVTPNKAFADMLGYTIEDLSRLRWQELTHPEDVDITEARIIPLLRGEIDSTRFVKRYIHKNGSILWADLNVSIRRDAAGKPLSYITTIIDVTERVKAEEALRESEAKFATLFNEAAIPLVLSRSPDYAYVDVNEAFMHVFGWTKEEAIGKNSRELGMNRDDDKRSRTVDSLRQGLGVENLEQTLYTKAGVPLTVLSSYNIISISGQDYALTSIQDITARKQAEEALNETSSYLDSLIKYANAPIIVWDPSRKITRFNRAFEELTGYMEDEVVGRDLGILFPLGTKAESLNKIDLALKGERWESVEIPIQRKEGEVRTALWNSANIHANDGATLISTIAQGVDITDRKKAEEALRETTEYLDSLITYANAPIIIWDPSRKITRFNRAFEQLTGYTASEVVGQGLEFLFPEETKAESLGKIGLALRGEYWESVEIPIQRKDGEVHTALWNSANVYAKDGATLISTIAQGVDITDRKEAEEKLHEAVASLARSNEELEQFALIASHDLQEPLRMISGYSQLLARRYHDKLDADAQDFINYSIDGANRMQKLIQELLAYSRVTTRGSKFTEVRMAEVLDEAVQNLRAAIEETGAEVCCNDLPTVYADRSQMVQLLQNLVGNSIKFRGAEPPRILLDAEERPEEWVITIADNGIGIDPKYFDRIFVIFQRLQGRDKYPGSGVGLALARRIVQRHGGNIWLESEPGKGSTFYISIPKNGGNDGG